MYLSQLLLYAVLDIELICNFHCYNSENLPPPSPPPPYTAQSHINFLYKEDSNGENVYNHLQRFLEIMPEATLEKIPSSLPGTNWLVQTVPTTSLPFLWNGIVNKRFLDINCSLLIVFLDGGPLVEVHGSILPFLNNNKGAYMCARA